MNYNEAVEKLKTFNQEHVLGSMRSLTRMGKKNFYRR